MTWRKRKHQAEEGAADSHAKAAKCHWGQVQNCRAMELAGELGYKGAKDMQ